MSTLLTTFGRSSLVQRVVSGTNYALPQYLSYGSGSNSALASDQALSNPYSGRVACTVLSATNATAGDTYRTIAIISGNSNLTISNIGLFDVVTNAPTGSLLTQLNPGATTVQVSGYNNFPTTFPFNIQINNEVIQVVSSGGLNTWNVARNVNGSPVSTNVIAANTVIVGASGTSNGNMFLESSFSSFNLNAGDSVQFTIDLQFS